VIPPSYSLLETTVFSLEDEAEVQKAACQIGIAAVEFTPHLNT